MFHTNSVEDFGVVLSLTLKFEAFILLRPTPSKTSSSGKRGLKKPRSAILGRQEAKWTS